MPSTDDSGTGPTASPLDRVSRTDSLRHDPRVRAAGLGLIIGFVTVPLLVLGGGWPPREASNTTFAFGALVLGFAVLSWTAAVMLGPAVENLQAYMDLGTGWTEAGARQAFAILSALGAGGMAGSVLGTMLVAVR